MPALHIRDVPESVMMALRERAAAHKRSVQAEVRDLLSRVAAEPTGARDLKPLDLVTTSTSGTTRWSRDEIYDDTAR